MTIDATTKKGGQYFMIRGCEKKTTPDDHFYYAVPGQTCTITFASLLLCTFKLEIAVASPDVKEQTLEISINESNYTRFSFAAGKTPNGALDTPDLHRFSVLLPAHRGKNTITITFANAAPDDSATQGNPPVSAVIFGLSLRPHASPLAKAAASLGQILSLRVTPTTPFGPLQQF